MDKNVIPEVSVVMPAYNAEKYISESINSVVSQSFKNWELIIIDDGSVDQTAAIVKNFCQKDERIIYYHQRNKKQGLARNAGIERSRGALIAFLDADDIWLPEKLETMVGELKKSGHDLLFSDTFILEESAGVNSGQLPKTYSVPEKQYSGYDGLKEFLEYNKIPTLTVVLKKEPLVQVGMFNDRSMAEDYEVWLKLLLNGNTFRSVAKPLCIYRVHPDSYSHHNRAALDDSIDIITKLRKTTSGEIYKLFTRCLKKWYKRKIASISNSAELSKAFNNIREQNLWPFKLALLSKLNIENPFFLRVTKSIAHRYL